MNICKCLVLMAFGCLSMLEGRSATAIDIPDAHAISIEKMAVFVKQKCSSKEDRLFTIQNWISKNIVYDLSCSGVTNMPFNLYGQDEELARLTLQKRRAVCVGFANLFALVANKAGVKVFCVEGYAKNSVTTDGHMWCAYMEDSVAYIIDPTWASGKIDYATGTYVKKMDKKYFMTSPDSVKFSHFPTDKLFQFSNHPLTYGQQVAGVEVDENEVPYFNWQDSLAAYMQQDEVTRNEFISRRIDQSLNGDKNVFTKEIRDKIINKRDGLLYNSLVEKYRRIQPKVSDLHNWIVDTKYVNHSVETLVRDSLTHMDAELAASEAKLKTITTKEVLVLVKEANKFVAMERKRIAICFSRLNERVKQREKQERR